MTLGDHLCSHEDLNFAAAHTLEDVAVVIMRIYSIAIHALDDRRWVERLQLLEDFLCSGTAVAELPRYFTATCGTRRADIERNKFETAIVAEEFMAMLMVCQRDRTIRALHHGVALLALQETREASTVVHDEGLAPGGERLIEQLLESGGDIFRGHVPRADASKIHHLNARRVRTFGTERE